MPLENIEEMVERQVRVWQEQNQVALPWEPQPDHIRAPVIAISRQHGALGARIGRIAAQRLEFSYFDREIVERIATTARVREAVVASVDERARSRFSDWLSGRVPWDRMTGRDYFEHLSTVLMSLAWHGRAVIVGRGACFLLDPSWTLRVRIEAPMDVRVARVATNHAVSLQDARTDVTVMDSDRAAFVRRHFDRDAGDPKWYDLLLDTGTQTPEECVDRLLDAFRERFGTGPTAP